jgi:hypothetical protein
MIVNHGNKSITFSKEKVLHLGEKNEPNMWEQECELNIEFGNSYLELALKKNGKCCSLFT